MASPADPAPKAPAAFANARLSLDDAERLAATFRPSWELDDAPFTGAGSLSPSDLQALQGGGTHADVRAVAAHGSNGTHAPATPAAAGHEVDDSVIIDRSITAEDIAPQGPGVKVGATMMGMPSPQLQQQPPVAQAPVHLAPQAAPQAPLQTAPRAPITRRPAAPSFNVSPPVQARARPVSVDLEPGFPRKSKAGLFVGVAAAAAILIGGAVWLIASPGSSEKVAPIPTVNKPLEDKLSSVPPPPPETAAQAQPAPTATTAAPPPATTAAAAPPTPIPTTPVTALPQATTAAPAPTRPVTAAAAPRPNYGSAPATPAPRPAARKPGQTIVRDVPF
jgi:hypothetical protein